MADSKVFGCKILLTDNASPVTEDTDIGLYNVTSDMASGKTGVLTYIDNFTNSTSQDVDVDTANKIIFEAALSRGIRSFKYTTLGAFALVSTVAGGQTLGVGVDTTNKIVFQANGNLGVKSYTYVDAGTLTHANTQTPGLTCYDVAVDPVYKIAFAVLNASQLHTYTYTTAGVMTHSDSDLVGTGAGYSVAVDYTNKIVFVTDTVDGVYSYKYDAAGTLTPVDVKDPGGGPAGVAVDSTNKIIFVASDSSGGFYTYKYDAAGNMTLVSSVSKTNCVGCGVDTVNMIAFSTDGGDGVFSYSYDTAGTLTYVDDDDKGGSASEAVADSINKLMFLANGARGIESYGYTVNGTSGQADITVDDADDFTAGELCTISDDNDSEQNVIDSIAGDVITFKQNLTNSYSAAASGKVDGNSEFRWLQNSITGVTNWVSGMITKNGLRSWIRQIDLRRGGNIAQPGGGGVQVRNTSQFWNSLDTLDIYMNGYRSEIWLFKNAVKERRCTRVCEQPTWDARTYTIPFKGDRNQRISNLTKRTNTTDNPNATGDILNNSIPITIGKMYPKFDTNDNPEYNGYAKFIRIADKTETFNNDTEITLNDNIVLKSSPDDLQIFPNVGNDGTTPPLQYSFKIGDSSLEWYQGLTQMTSGTYDLSYLEDYYIHVIEGTEEDSFRRIENAYVDIDTDPTLIVASISDYFSETLDGNAAATHEDNSWMQFDKVQSDYQIDTWPCKNYLNTTGTAVTQAFDLYAFDNDKKVKLTVTGDAETVNSNVQDAPLSFLRLPSYGYEDYGNGDKNRLKIDVKFFEESPDQMNSFLIEPVTDVNLITGDSTVIAGNWDIPGDETGISARIEIQPGFYTSVPAANTVTVNDGDLTNVTDKNSSSAYDANIVTAGGAITETYFGVEFNPPSIPSRIDFDNIYLGIKFEWDWPNMPLFLNQTATFFMRWRRWFGTPKSILEVEENAQSALTASMYFYDLPDFYYADGINTNNQDFYYKDIGVLANDTRKYTGYVLYPLPDVSSKEQYDSIYNMLFMIKNFGIAGTEFNMKMYELAIIFKKEISIKNSLFSPFYGRVINSTWDSRKTATDPVESPIVALEHVNRLQNYADNSPQPTSGFGLGYSLGAKIKTGITVDGSFDNAVDLGSLLTDKIAGQVQDYNLSYSDKLKTSLCRDFFLGSWVDKDGFECVRSLLTSTVPTDTITLGDITDRTKIKFTERSPADIYAEPFVRYKKNMASKEYEGLIRVTNASAASYVSGYIEGVSSESQAEAIWDICHDMWQRTKTINPPPADLTDKIWFNNPDTADELAKEYLENWITWMSRDTVKFPAHFNTVGDWEETHPFYLQLPHQTNNVTIKCNLAKITISPNPPYTCTVEAVIEGDIPEAFYIKDTWVNFGNDNDWKNAWTAQGDPDDIKDTM